MIADVILRFKTKPIAQAHVGTKPPLIFPVKARIDHRDASERQAASNSVLAGSAAGRLNLRGRQTLL